MNSQVIPAEAVEAAAKAHFERDGGRWEDWTAEEKSVELEDMRAALEAAAPHILAGRESVTEWAAAFPQTGNIYNYHRTREEAQAFVDGMAEVGAEMAVMTREVLPQDASEWRPTRAD